MTSPLRWSYQLLGDCFFITNRNAPLGLEQQGGAVFNNYS
jgi:hypothetical protein